MAESLNPTIGVAVVIVAAVHLALALATLGLASALAIINVMTHIRFSLELDPPNYSTWWELFLTLVNKFNASSHIDGTLAPKNLDASLDSDRLLHALSNILLDVSSCDVPDHDAQRLYL
jgi:hypothetical protein